MKSKILSTLLAASMVLSQAAFPVKAENNALETISYNYNYDPGTGYSASERITRSMEKLGRGLVAVKTADGVYLSWRLLDSEDMRYGSASENVSFNVYKDGKLVDNVTSSTNYLVTSDKSGTGKYSVAPVIGGAEGEKCDAVSVMNTDYIDIPLVKPADETIYDPSGAELATYSFFPADCSAGDLNGDGEYEIVVKWTSSERDVGSPGDPAYSGTVHLAAYTLGGKRMWTKDIELGKNVYSSAHTVQFLVYDFDGDGKAEITCQTSLGSKDATGTYVTKCSSESKIKAFSDSDNENADYRGYGRVIRGEEFLTVFSGETGAAVDTITLPMSRETSANDLGASFGDDFGNRSNRFVADVAYLDGAKPYAVYLRGYYFGRNNRQRTSIAGISFDGEKLTPVYRFDTEKGQPGYYTGAEKYVGQGNHNCTVADVDNDGKDEFITGAACYEVDESNALKVKWSTLKGHGDALHIGDYDPTHNGLEFFTVHEDSNAYCNFGQSVIDAATGDILFHADGADDTGRGLMGNMGLGGYYQISSSNAGYYMASGNGKFSPISTSIGANFRVFWDGDLYDESLDGTKVDGWDGSKFTRLFTANGCTKINGTKSNPALQADLFGDWREELVYPTTDGNTLRVYTTTTPTEYKIKTLMHDPVYRSGVAAQQTAYNQPPHVGFYMGSELFDPEISGLSVLKAPEKTTYAYGEELDTTGIVLQATYVDGTKKTINAFSVSGYDPTVIGKQTVTATYAGMNTTFEVYVKDVARILVMPPTKTKYFVNQKLDTRGMVVTAIYSDDTRSDVTNYEIGEYDTSKAGTAVITVTYAGKSATFEITVEEGSIGSINGLYETASTDSNLSEFAIGAYEGTFTLTHTLKINSMPKSGTEDKNSAEGFFVRFNPSEGTGAGWYIADNGNGTANVYWKSGANRNNAKLLTANAAMSVGSTYTFRYDFTDVATGNGAFVTVTIADETGNVLGSVSGLDLRNMSFSNIHLKLPLAIVQIYNQSNGTNKSSVEIGGAAILSGKSLDSLEIETPPTKTVYNIGEQLDTAGMAVKAVYSDGTSEYVPLADCGVFCDTSSAGSKTAFVAYGGKWVTFTIAVNGGDWSVLNGTYETASTETVTTEKKIGSYSGDFSVEHTFKINSMPANGLRDKNNTNGFFVRFNAASGVGGGWFINVYDSENADIIWKDSVAYDITTDKAIKVGKTYKFVYDFTDVATGNGAHVAMRVYDEDGGLIAYKDNLGLRNMTADKQKTSPLEAVYIYNQSNGTAASNIEIGQARIAPEEDSSIISLNGSEILMDIKSLDNLVVYAAKYDENGALEKVELIPLSSKGIVTHTAGFEPDKVFMWTSDYAPISIKTK